MALTAPSTQPGGIEGNWYKEGKRWKKEVGSPADRKQNKRAKFYSETAVKHETRKKWGVDVEKIKTKRYEQTVNTGDTLSKILEQFFRELESPFPRAEALASLRHILKNNPRFNVDKIFPDDTVLIENGTLVLRRKKGTVEIGGAIHEKIEVSEPTRKELDNLKDEVGTVIESTEENPHGITVGSGWKVTSPEGLSLRNDKGEIRDGNTLPQNERIKVIDPQGIRLKGQSGKLLLKVQSTDAPEKQGWILVEEVLEDGKLSYFRGLEELTSLPKI